MAANNKTLPISELLNALAEQLSDVELLSAKIQSDISLAISNERIRRGMNQSEFSKLLGVSQTQVSKWENSDVNFTIKKLSEIATKLNMKFTCALTAKSSVAGAYLGRTNNVISVDFNAKSSHSFRQQYRQTDSVRSGSWENVDIMEG